MLCDITKVHTGYGLMPRVTHCTEEEGWGKPGAVKKVFVAKTWAHAGGFASRDKVVERIENEYWKIEVSDFQSYLPGFDRMVGEWKTTEVQPNVIRIDYTYTLHSSRVLLFPFQAAFAYLFWKTYMKRVLENIRRLPQEEAPYLFE